MMPWLHSLQLRTLVYLFLATRIAVTAQNFTDAQINKANMRLAETARASWELGTRAETILEQSGRYSVFSMESLPPPSEPGKAALAALRPMLEIANGVASGNHSKPHPLVQDGSQADPASIGVAVLIANLTKDAHGGKYDYAGAAWAQVAYLLRTKMKFPDGAISHREDALQIWSDSVYMIPPFLAYYGVVTENINVVNEAYNQIDLYRKHLRNNQNMWMHISDIDTGCWSTGNGWAAAGILRVYATLSNSKFEPSLRSKLQDLSTWVQEIHSGMYANLDDTSIFLNYADRDRNSNNFYDAASTALLASTVYRAAKILNQTEYLSQAERSRKKLSTPDHFTQDGVLFPVVDPYHVGSQAGGGMISPEAQAFVVQMHQAWKEWTM